MLGAMAESKATQGARAAAEAQSSNSSSQKRTIPNLVRNWDGKQVWAILDKNEGMWRQATVLAVVPSVEPTDGWDFIVDTKHDNWRHVIEKQSPSDEMGTTFESVQVTEFAVLPGADPFNEYKAPSWFDLLPGDSPKLRVTGGVTPVHPYVADEIRSVRALNIGLRAENDQLRVDLETKIAELEHNRLEEARLRAALLAAEDERRASEAVLISQLEQSSVTIAALKLVEPPLLVKIENLKAMINEVQGENNSLSAKLTIMTNEAVKLRAQIAQIQSENGELVRENERLKGAQSNSGADAGAAQAEKTALTAENKTLRDKLLYSEEALDTAEAKLADARARFSSELDRLKAQLASRNVAAGPRGGAGGGGGGGGGGEVEIEHEIEAEITPLEISSITSTTDVEQYKVQNATLTALAQERQNELTRALDDIKSLKSKIASYETAAAAAAAAHKQAASSSGSGSMFGFGGGGGGGGGGGKKTPKEVAAEADAEAAAALVAVLQDEKRGLERRLESARESSNQHEAENEAKTRALVEQLDDYKQRVETYKERIADMAKQQEDLRAQADAQAEAERIAKEAKLKEAESSVFGWTGLGL